MAFNASEKQLHAAILDYLVSIRSKVADPEGLEVAVGVVAEAFALPVPSDATAARGAASLLAAFQSGSPAASPAAAAAAAPAMPSAEGVSITLPLHATNDVLVLA